MSNIDYDNPDNEEQWCAKQRQIAVDFMNRQGTGHGPVGDVPAWHVTPYVSIWAVESKLRAGSVGWWVICGDLPTDYVSAAEVKHPREVLMAVGERWHEVASFVERGEPHPSVSIGSSENWQELVPLLRSRANILCDWASDDALW